MPGTHFGSIQADRGDSFVGGREDGRTTVLSGKYAGAQWAIDSNSTLGDQTHVTIEYLTIEKYLPDGNAGAINQDSNEWWTIRFNTIKLNVPGAGVILGANNQLNDNCMTLNGQYGFQSTATDSWGRDILTGGPFNVKVLGNEISYNDTCDFEGRLQNRAIGWKNHNPVPRRFRNSRCGTVTPDGDEGGFKLWETNGVTIGGNYIHNNWGPGAWVDTDNANTTLTGNKFVRNDDEAIIEELSYNFSITRNYMADNGWIGGLSNARFPWAAIYVSESGSDRTFGGVPACSEKACASQGSYPNHSVISRNTLVNNSGNFFLWQNSNRFCSDGSDGVCTLVHRGRSGPFSISRCRSNLPTASVNRRTYRGRKTGSPREDWWDGCLWRTENVSITHNKIDFDPAKIAHCNHRAWPDCGAGGIFSEYGSPPNKEPGWVVPTEITFFQGNVWSDNTYNGPSHFYAWSAGNGDNPVTWADWTRRPRGKCSSAGARQSGYCTGPFGQDAGSTFTRSP